MTKRAERLRLLFICLDQSSFVLDDLEMLREEFEVELFQFDGFKKTGRFNKALSLASGFATQWGWLQREIPEADLVFGWFADYHMFLPTLLASRRKTPVAVMLGGMDCNHLPELNYGVWDSRWRSRLARQIIADADRLIAPDASLLRWSSRYTSWPDMHEDGLETHTSKAVDAEVISPGFEADAWPLAREEPERRVLSVAYIKDDRTVRVKGIDLLIEVARVLPKVDFQVIGVDSAFEPALRNAYHPPENVQLQPPRDRADLSEAYQQASVYAQLSRVESFGMVVGEAMLSGCVPVVSDVGALPRLAASAGIVVEQPNAQLIADAIQQALSAGRDQREEGRRHIAKTFSLEKRRQQLLALLNEMVTGSAAESDRRGDVLRR